MEIIKEAFTEGRETKTQWELSQAKKNQLQVDIALENFSLMKRREFRQVIPLKQICPLTGKVLNVFTSRFAAATYIVNEILKRPDKNPLAVTGNIEMCMRAGWKAYGFFWKLANPKEFMNGDKERAGTNLWISKGLRGGVFNSIESASQAFKLSPDFVSKRLKNKKSNRKMDGVCIQAYNPIKRTLNFDTVASAARYAGVHDHVMLKWVDKAREINNTVYTVTTRKVAKREYNISQGNKIIATYNKAKDVAKHLKVHSSSITRYVNSKKLIGVQQLRVTVKNINTSNGYDKFKEFKRK